VVIALSLSHGHSSASADTIAALIERLPARTHCRRYRRHISDEILLDHPFDYIFFTGGVNTGTEIM
jgi:hypothetical protein